MPERQICLNLQTQAVRPFLLDEGILQFKNHLEIQIRNPKWKAIQVILIWKGNVHPYANKISYSWHYITINPDSNRKTHEMKSKLVITSPAGGWHSPTHYCNVRDKDLSIYLI